MYVVQCVFVWFCLKNLGYNLYGLQSTVSCCLMVLHPNFSEKGVLGRRICVKNLVTNAGVWCVTSRCLIDNIVPVDFW